MMGSGEKELNDVEDTVFVAVGKHVKESESTLLWAAHNFPGKKICLLHVHQPSNLLTFFDGKLAFYKLKKQPLKVLRELEVQKVHKLFEQYILLLAHTGVEIDKVWMEMENIEEGIVKLIALHGIRSLVMGAAADKRHTKGMVEPKSSKAIYVCQEALFSCQIWFACNGCLIYTREAEKDNPVACISPEQLPVNLKGLNGQAEDEKSNHAIKELGFIPMVTSRECPSNLRSRPFDFCSHEANNVGLSSPTDSLASRRGCITKEEEANQLDITAPVLTSHRSFNSRRFAGKTMGRGEEIQDKLEQAILGVEDLKQVGYGESVKCWKAEEDSTEAKVKDEAAKSSFMEEAKQRKELEEALFTHKQELKRMKDECEEYMNNLVEVRGKSSLLQSKIAESNSEMRELEEKIIAAVDLLITFRNRRDRLKIECENASHELKRLRRLKQARPLKMNGGKLPEFSFLEISKATCGFDPSKRIGEGRFGSVYQGLLRHTKVAIRMLPNDSSRSPLEFQHEVEVLSRVRHPNLVALIGMCSESRSLVYEFMERGSLEDHLACRGNRDPLPWETRVSIATQLCSSLIFLHKSYPPIVHGNLKPSKILIDSNFVSKIVDLGILHLASKNQVRVDWLHDDDDHADTYRSSLHIDLEFLETRDVTPSSDMHSFGVILLRLLTGRPSLGIVEDVKSSLEEDTFCTILDFSAGDWPISEAERLARLSLMCCERKRWLPDHLASDIWNVLETMRNLSNVAASCLVAKEQRRPPPHFVCPIYQEIMKDPQTAADGFTYEGEAIQGWFSSSHKTSPMTNLKLAHCDLIRNHALYYAIQDWMKSS
ncbi:hypothetical protein Dimus_028240 [Dionaea muscipula]